MHPVISTHRLYYYYVLTHIIYIPLSSTIQDAAAYIWSAGVGSSDTIHLLGLHL